MRVSKKLIATSITYGGAEARLRGVLEPPEPPPVHATGCGETKLFRAGRMAFVDIPVTDSQTDNCSLASQTSQTGSPIKNGHDR